MLATRLKAVAHSESTPRFFEAIEEEEFSTLEDRLSALKGTILIAIDGNNADYHWQPDNMTEQPQYFFVIVSNTNSTRTESTHHAQSSARLIARQIIARMMQDSMMGEYGLSNVDLDSFVVRGVGPILDNFYGVLLGFNMLNSFAFTLDKDYWL